MLNDVFSANQEMIIKAMAIGDGSITKDGRLSLLHSIKQIEYLTYKKCLLESHEIQCSDVKIYNSSSFGKPLQICMCRTRRYKELFKYRDDIYTPSKSIYTKELLERLTPEHIALWYMDDGNIWIKQKTKTKNYYAIKFSTYTSLQTSKLLERYFLEHWNVSFHSSKRSRLSPSNIRNNIVITNQETNYIIESSKQTDVCRFLRIVEPFVSAVKCMRHKII